MSNLSKHFYSTLEEGEVRWAGDPFVSFNYLTAVHVALAELIKAAIAEALQTLLSVTSSELQDLLMS